jgi:hypothetical protein
MDSRIQKLRGAARAAIAAQVQGLFKEPRPDPARQPPNALPIAHEHEQHHEWISRVHERFPTTPSQSSPSTMLVNVVVGGRIAMTLRLPEGSPLPAVGEDVTLPWPFGDTATMSCRVTRRDFQLLDGEPPAVALRVQPLI